MPKGYKSRFNENFFGGDSEESFYWAGFIAADGCVREYRSKYSLLHSLEIALSGKDASHLEKFKTSIDGDFQLNCRVLPNKNISGENLTRTHIKITSKLIFDNLARFGISPRKSLTLEFPKWLETHPLVRHFLRGYFDGDGGFYLNKSRKHDPQMTLRICGTIPFLETYNRILQRDCEFDSVSAPYMHNGQGALNYSGNVRCNAIGRYLYDGAKVFLDRKHQQALNIDVRLKTLDVEEVTKYYRMYWSTTEVAKVLGYTQSGIALFMRRNGLSFLYKEKLDNGIKSTGINGRVVNTTEKVKNANR